MLFCWRIFASVGVDEKNRENPMVLMDFVAESSFSVGVNEENRNRDGHAVKMRERWRRCSWLMMRELGLDI